MKTVLSLLLVSAALFVGCTNEDNNHNGMPQHDGMSQQNSTSADSSLVRDANVDVSSIDINKDGKVYQCPMHFEVISDHSATCPLCKMDLEEVSVTDAASNLK